MLIVFEPLGFVIAECDCVPFPNDFLSLREVLLSSPSPFVRLIHFFFLKEQSLCSFSIVHLPPPTYIIISMLAMT